MSNRLPFIHASLRTGSFLRRLRIVLVLLWIAGPVAAACLACARRHAALQPASPDTGVVTVFYGTDRAGEGTDFQDCIGEELRFGAARVSIPARHKAGRLEGAPVSSLRGPDANIRVLSVEPMTREEWTSRLSAEMRSSGQEAAFVFVPGFAVSFDGGARRAAQMAFDMGLPEHVVLYSWPSANNVAQYWLDYDSAEETAPHLEDFLETVDGCAGEERLTVAGHSLGNRALLRAAEGMALRQAREGGTAPLFEELAFLAPDVQNKVFCQTIGRIRPLAGRVTLYTSRDDYSLGISRKMRRGVPRAGDSSRGPLLAPGLFDTIDASTVETQFFGHNYYRDCPRVLADLNGLARGLPAGDRGLLAIRGPDGAAYWRLPK
ncbi:alpha/beta hydrolase [Candidatus Poribacteria bacterium]|nr:alpha/beta hydrolase [Candidatus Poribacteria bacterium]